MLLVEDDPGHRELVPDILTQEDYRLTAAASAAQALAALAVAPFDLVLTDALVTFVAGQPDYWRTLDTIAAHAGAARLVILTAYPERDFHNFRRHGFTATITKPFHLAALVGVVAGALPPREHDAVRGTRARPT